MNRTIGRLCAFYIYEGLCEGLSHFSGTSRAAVIFAAKPGDPMHVYDPQNLLEGHELKLKEMYLDSKAWQENGADMQQLKRYVEPIPEKNIELAGLISRGGRSFSIFYQMWFTEHHPDICSVGPTERWLEHAVSILAHDVVVQDACSLGTSAYALREYATHAVRDYIVDELNLGIGMDVQMRVYPILDAVLGISKTLEEGAWPLGEMVFIEPRRLEKFNYMLRFPPMEQPDLSNFKHVRKLLQAVECSKRKLVSDGKTIVGIASGDMPSFVLSVDFREGFGFLKLNGNQVCSFSDGAYHSSINKANLVELEEILLESKLSDEQQHDLFKTVLEIVHDAENHKHGCTLVIDFSLRPEPIAGQHIEKPLDLHHRDFLGLTKSLSKLDGALHIGSDMKLYGFACILDGLSVPHEDRSRGARYNSALRFTAKHNDKIVIVVSSDRPVSVIQEGVELTAHCAYRPISVNVPTPLKLEDWLSSRL